MTIQKRMLLILVVACFSLPVAAQPFVGKDGKYIRKGCKVVLGEPRRDTMLIVDPITGEEVMKERISGLEPDSINGKKVYNTNEVTSMPQSYTVADSIDAYLLKNLKCDIKKLPLPDGVLKIDLQSLIIDEKGRVVYFEYRGIRCWDKDGSMRYVREKLGPIISKLMENAPVQKPASIDGNDVVAYTDQGAWYDLKIKIKKHLPVGYERGWP